LQAGSLRLREHPNTDMSAVLGEWMVSAGSDNILTNVFDLILTHMRWLPDIFITLNNRQWHKVKGLQLTKIEARNLSLGVISKPDGTGHE
jgi:hypothetical protein